jgi:hypothetical protein
METKLNNDNKKNCNMAINKDKFNKYIYVYITNDNNKNPNPMK